MNCNTKPDTHMYNMLSDMPLGSAYVPWQKFSEVFEADKGLKYGCIFAELVMPFYGAEAACASCGRRGYV